MTIICLGGYDSCYTHRKKRENEVKYVIKHTQKFEFGTGVLVAAICSLTVENSVENFVLRGWHIPIIRCIFVVGLGDELLS